MGTDYPIRTGAPPTGNPHSYGDIDAIRALLDATDAGAIKSAGDAYKAASQNMEGFKTLLVRASKILSEVWEDEAATEAEKALRKLKANADGLATVTNQMGAALDRHGGEILPWYVAHKPGTGWIKDDGDDEYAREYMQRLNNRIAEAWSNLPASMSQEGMPENKDSSWEPIPTGSSSAGPASGSSGGSALSTVPTRYEGGSATTGANSHEVSSANQADTPYAQTGSSPVNGPVTHPASLPGAASTDSAPTGSASIGNTDLAGLESPHPNNAQGAFQNPNGRLGPLGPSPSLGGPAAVPSTGIGGPPGALGPMSEPSARSAASGRPVPLSGPGGTSGARPGTVPGRGNMPGGFPAGAQNPTPGASATGRTGARGMPTPPMGGGGGQQNSEERGREYWLTEDHEIWGAEDSVDAVIGGTPAVVDEDTDDPPLLLDETAETWGAEPTPSHIIGQPAPRTADAEPQSDQPQPCSCGCACGDSDGNGRAAKEKENREQEPPPRLEASPFLRGE